MPSKLPEGQRKVQRSVALPPSYWQFLDDAAHERREKTAVLASQLLHGAIDRMKSDAKQNSDGKQKQPDLFSSTKPRKAPAKKAAKKAAAPRGKKTAAPKKGKKPAAAKPVPAAPGLFDELDGPPAVPEGFTQEPGVGHVAFTRITPLLLGGQLRVVIRPHITNDTFRADGDWVIIIHRIEAGQDDVEIVQNKGTLQELVLMAHHVAGA